MFVLLRERVKVFLLPRPLKASKCPLSRLGVGWYIQTHQWMQNLAWSPSIWYIV